MSNKEKLAMADVETDDNIYIRVKDIVHINKIPESVKEDIARYSQGMKKLPCGLPASGFLGKNGCKITGIFRYGKITFISYIGKDKNIMGDTLIHLFLFRTVF